MNVIKTAFSRLWTRVLEEPVYTQALVVAGIAMGTAFGLSWDGTQVGAVTAFSAAVLAFMTRQAVTPLENPSIPAGTVLTVTTPEGQPDRVVTA
jgi:uncharacterized membrane protein YjjP (DUF1212 family)